MEIRLAKTPELHAVCDFYWSLIAAAAESEYPPGWQKEVYPTTEMLCTAIRQEELFLGLEKGEIIAAAIVDHEGNESYRSCDWPTKAAPEEVTMIHALGVHPGHTRQGLARQLLDAIIARAKDCSQRCIRLDVLKGKLPAERLYQAAGFHLLHELEMFYEDTGWTLFLLYELAL